MATIYYDSAVLGQDTSFKSVASHEKLVIDGYFGLLGSAALGQVSFFNGPIDINAGGHFDVGPNDADTAAVVAAGGQWSGNVTVRGNARIDSLSGAMILVGPGNLSGTGLFNLGGQAVLDMLAAGRPCRHA